MPILFITTHPYLPQLHGGMQSSADELCTHLKHRGHRVAVLAGLTPTGSVGWKSRIKMRINKRRVGCKVARDHVSEYRVWRTWFAWMHFSTLSSTSAPSDRRDGRRAGAHGESSSSNRHSHSDAVAGRGISLTRRALLRVGQRAVRRQLRVHRRKVPNELRRQPYRHLSLHCRRQI
jgi:hypothetical protein